MNKDVWGDEIAEDKSTVVLADTEDKFYKMLYVFSQKLAYTAFTDAAKVILEEVDEDGNVDMEKALKTVAKLAAQNVDTFKIIFNDYHCLVRDKKIGAINLPHDDASGINELKKQFEEEVKDATMELAMAGVPVKEKDDGTIETDYKTYIQKEKKDE